MKRNSESAGHDVRTLKKMRIPKRKPASKTKIKDKKTQSKAKEKTIHSKIICKKVPIEPKATPFANEEAFFCETCNVSMHINAKADHLRGIK